MFKIFLMFSMLISDVYIRPPVYIQHTRFSVLLQANIMTFVTCALTAFNESTPPSHPHPKVPFLPTPLLPSHKTQNPVLYKYTFNVDL